MAPKKRSSDAGPKAPAPKRGRQAGSAASGSNQPQPAPIVPADPVATANAALLKKLKDDMAELQADAPFADIVDSMPLAIQAGGREARVRRTYLAPSLCSQVLLRMHQHNLSDRSVANLRL